MALTLWISSAGPPPTWIAYSGFTAVRTPRSNFRLNLNWRSISKPLRRLGSMSRQLCSFVPKNGRLALKATHWMINHVLQDEAAAGRISN